MNKTHLIDEAILLILFNQGHFKGHHFHAMQYKALEKKEGYYCDSHNKLKFL